MPVTIIAAATEDGGASGATLLLVVLAMAALYVIGCLWRPWTACSRCGGSPRFKSGDGRYWRDCPRCGGSGKQIRLGARVLRGLRGGGE